jgi:multisubunit Na+/H+ antiporter MnhB subunit
MERGREGINPMRGYYDDRIVALSSRLVVPFIQLFALYVVFHGHYSPGGGFQGGAMLAASFLLIRLSVATIPSFPWVWARARPDPWGY